MAKSNLESLAEFLDENKIAIRFKPSAVPSSIIHDAGYRIAILSLAFAVLGKIAENGSDLELNANMLALGQFIATRPKLYPDFERWVVRKIGRDISLFEWPHFPRGYFTDSVHTNSVNALIALGELKWSANDILLWKQKPTDLLSRSIARVMNEKLFAQERDVLAKIKGLKLNLKLLGIR